MRLILTLLFMLTLLYADASSLHASELVADQNSTSKRHVKISDKNSTHTDDMLNSLESYDSATASGTLPSRDTAVESVENNDSDLISATTKLDDVSSLDIAKEQRKQRKIAQKEEMEDVEHVPVDTVVVKGSVLQGQINVLTSEYLSFKLIYGEGSIRIDYQDIESLQTEHEYHIYFDGKETQGYITGIKEHAFLQIQHGEVEELITIAKIDRFVISEQEDNSFENRMRNTFPYWRGSLDIGIEYETQKAYNKKKLKVGGHVERKQARYRTLFDVTYSYESTTSGDDPSVLNKHEMYSFLEQDITIFKSDLLFAEVGYDFDVPRYVDNRLYPSLGYGYRLASKKNRWIQFKVGAGFVYENFLADPDANTTASKNQYVAGLFGIDGEYEFSDLQILNRILFSGHFFYMPAMRDLKDNWLLRYSIAADIPLSKTLSFKAVGRTVTDDNPSDSVGNNKTTFDLYLRIRF